MFLDKRLSAVVSEIVKCNVIADIGADHGKIAIYAKENKLADLVIASDISNNSIEKTRKAIAEKNLDISVRVGDGVSVLSQNECDTVIIAGMGGKEIISILDCDSVFNRYILVPHRDAKAVREFLLSNTLTTVKDYKVESSNKFYDIIVAERGIYNPNEIELEYGKLNSNCSKKFVILEVKKLKNLLEVANGKSLEDISRKLRLLEFWYEN